MCKKKRKKGNSCEKKKMEYWFQYSVLGGLNFKSYIHIVIGGLNAKNEKRNAMVTGLSCCIWSKHIPSTNEEVFSIKEKSYPKNYNVFTNRRFIEVAE